MRATFAPEGSALDRLGFDEAASPPWIMVPADPAKTRIVILKDGAGLSLQLANSAKTGIVTFTEQPATGARRILLAGTAPGTVLLEARDSTGAAQATLEITVKAQKKLNTFIHFVFDKKGNSSIKGLTEALQMMNLANKLLSQANVVMVRRDSGGFTLPFDMERGLPIPVAFNMPSGWIQTPGPWPCISKDPPGPQGCLPPATQGSLSREDFNGIRINNIMANILSHADPRSDYNIFFVRRLDDPGVAPAQAFTLTNPTTGLVINSCLLPDISNGQSLAHEVGHFLLRGATFLSRTGHTTGHDDLMTEVPGPFHVKIPKQSANFMNPSGVP